MNSASGAEASRAHRLFQLRLVVRVSPASRQNRLHVILKSGGVGERLKPAVLKTVRLERVSGVRIPPPPPDKPPGFWASARNSLSRNSSVPANPRIFEAPHAFRKSILESLSV